ncbi:MAG: response regulator transcription factor [Bacteroidota bacterium]
MEKQITSIVLIEDHKIISDGLISAFENNSRYEIIATAGNGEEALRLLSFQQPDIVILDLNLPDTDGLELLKTLRKKGVTAKVVVLTMYNKTSLINEVQKQGANAYLLKNSSVSELIQAFNTVLSGPEFYMGRGTKTRSTVSEFEEDDFIKKLKLTGREKEIIKQVMKGQNVPQIAEELCISSFTVETHKKNIFKKLNIHTSIDLINFVKEHEISL